MLCAPRIAHHAVQRPRFAQHLVDGCLDRRFFRHVGFQCEELVGVFGGQGAEVVAGRADVERVDFAGAVGEAAVCYAEADACVFFFLVFWGV